jgi:hypothetical protein
MKTRNAVSAFVVALVGTAAAGCAPTTAEPSLCVRDASATESGAKTRRCESPWGREALHVRAKGVQSYRVERSADGSLASKFIGPRADLYDDTDRKIGTHFMGATGPVWEIGGRRVTGKRLRERPSAVAGSIPALQLAALDAGADGPFAGVTVIERLATVGGAAPVLDASRHEGEVFEVPYEARYVFYAATV